ncbi:hypothetical protein [Pararhodobacter oceanensis]|uniref:hypothetical protein n=1 Tax=Pararhodobacter oceanensis TaxID=2172121 RepID=UPI003A93CF41
MVNTRILEQRLGWRRNASDPEVVPKNRPIAHVPMLQGRVDTSARGGAPGPRRLAVAEAWDNLPVLEDAPDALAARAGLVPAIDRGSLAGASFDQLRTQLTRALKANDWRRVGISSATRGAGRSFFAAGLAASIARLDAMRVLLVDADLESPGLAALFHAEAPGPISEVLTGARAPETQLMRMGSGLALALNDTPEGYGAELLLAPEGILALRAMNDLLAPDVMILDMPPLLDDPLAQALLPQLDAVLLVADGQRNTAHEISECERMLDGQVPLLGLALNKSEDRDPRHAPRRRA